MLFEYFLVWEKDGLNLGTYYVNIDIMVSKYAV